MARKFKETTRRPAVDRLSTLRRATETARTRTPAPPTRGGASPLESRMAGMRGGGSAPGQGAIDFGRAMTGGDSGVQNAVNAIRARVANQLAGKGIYQDQSGYHIQGLNQPPDIGIAMRDAAVHAMGGDPWTKIVQEADARLRAGNLPLPTTAGVNGPTPSPGLGGVPSVSGGTSRTVTPPTVSTPVTRGAAPQPGLGGVPSIPSAQPRVAPSGAVPQPGLGGVPQAPPRPSNVTPFPPQGQGVGRTATPTGNQISPGQYPTTAPSPGLGGVPPAPMGGWHPSSTTVPNPQPGVFERGAPPSLPPPLPGPQRMPGLVPTPGPQRMPVQGGIPPVPLSSPQRVGVSQPSAVTPAMGSSINANDRMGISAPTQQSIDNGAFNPYQQPLSPSGTGGNQGLDPNASQQQRIGVGTGGQVIGSAIGTNLQNSATVTPPGRVNPQSGVPSPGLGGVPQLSGRPATPTVAPGALPGNTTPSRPGQMPSVFPNGKVFGSPGSPFGPNFPFGDRGAPGAAGAARAPGALNGAQLAQDIISRVQGVRSQNQMPGHVPGQQPGASPLEGLGERIRASIQGGLSGMPRPGAPTMPAGLGTDITSIMSRVQGQLQQGGLGQTPTLGAPSQGAAPGGIPDPGGPITAAPAPGGTSPMPTGTGQLSAMGGKYAPLDQYNAAFEAAGKEFGVPPELLKSMAGIESGWTGDPSVCRDDGLGDGASCGIMQVKSFHTEAGCTNQNDPVCNIRTAAAILKGGYDACGNWDCAITGVYFTQNDSNGTTQQDYLNVVHQSMQEQAANPGGPPTTGTQVLPTNGPQQIDPATGAPIGATPVTGAGGGTSQPPAPSAAPAPAPGGVATGSPAPAMNTSYADSGAFNAATDPMAPGSFKPQFIVYHITAGSSFDGPTSYDQNGDGSPDGSTNYVIDKDGTIYELVKPGSAMPWANGQVNGAGGVNQQKGLLAQAAQTDNLNNQTISIEMVAQPGDQLTPQQVQAGQSLTSYLSGQYSIPLDDQHLVGHNDIDQTGRGQDPISVYTPMDMVPMGVASASPSGGAVGGTTQGGGVYNTMASPVGQGPNGQPVSSIDAQSTGWADALVPGGSQQVVQGGYGFGADQGMDLYGNYNNWPCSTCHPGVDVATNGSQQYNALTGGTVTCVGGQSALQSGGATQDGSVSCGAYADDGGGVGNVSVLKNDGALVIYGHSRSNLVGLGQTVQSGQPLGMSGSGGGYHVHEEVQLPIGPGGSYTPVDPNLYYSGYYCSVGFCPS